METLANNRQGKPRVVRLSNAEQSASAAYEYHLDRGLSVTDAVAKVRSTHPDLSDEFYDWLAG